MKLIVTKHAFERYRERAAAYPIDFYGFQNRLRKVTRSEVCFIEWNGKPALYFNGSYWRYVRNENKNEITLVTCLGVLESISNGKWSRLNSAKERRASRKIMKMEEGEVH